MKKKTLFWIVAIFGILLGACSGLWWQQMEADVLTPVHRSLARLVVFHPVDPLTHIDSKEPNPDIYGTFIEMIESAEMLRKARIRVQERYPSPEDYVIDVRGIRSRNSGIIAILATGDEPKYTQIFLNAVLDEFMAFRRSMLDQKLGHRLDVQLQEVAVLHKDLESAREAWGRAWNTSLPTNRTAEEQRLTSRLTSLRDMRDDSDLELKLATDDTTRQAARTRLDTLNAEVKQAEALLLEVSTTNANLQDVEKSLDRAQQAYDEASRRAKECQREIDEYTDVVGILERATQASEHLPNTQSMLATGLFIGSVLGGILSAPFAFLITLKPARRPPPLPSPKA